jgi:hypothetical protein
MSVKNKATILCGVCNNKPCTRTHRFKKSRYLLPLCDDCEPKLCTCPRDVCQLRGPTTICREETTINLNNQGATMNTNTYAVSKRNFWQWLFPTRHLLSPNDQPGYAESYLVTGAICVFDFVDRLRILVSGKVEVLTYTKTDVIVNRALSTSVAYVLPPTYRVRKKDACLHHQEKTYEGVPRC